LNNGLKEVIIEKLSKELSKIKKEFCKLNKSSKEAEVIHQTLVKEKNRELSESEENIKELSNIIKNNMTNI
jgi:hypothetical protein